MRRVPTTRALALYLLGCGSASKGEPIELLTGLEACKAGGQVSWFLIRRTERGSTAKGL